MDMTLMFQDLLSIYAWKLLLAICLKIWCVKQIDFSFITPGVSTHVQVYHISLHTASFDHTDVKTRVTKFKDFCDFNFVTCAWNWAVPHVASWNNVNAGYRNQDYVG